MAPMCDVARIPSKSLVLQAAKGMAKEQLEKEKKRRLMEKEHKRRMQALIDRLKNANEELKAIDRVFAKYINKGEAVPYTVVQERRIWKQIKANLAQDIKKAR